MCGLRPTAVCKLISARGRAARDPREPGAGRVERYLASSRLPPPCAGHVMDRYHGAELPAARDRRDETDNTDNKAHYKWGEAGHWIPVRVQIGLTVRIHHTVPRIPAYSVARREREKSQRCENVTTHIPYIDRALVWLFKVRFKLGAQLLRPSFSSRPYRRLVRAKGKCKWVRARRAAPPESDREG